jgi:hypothetical protein
VFRELPTLAAALLSVALIAAGCGDGDSGAEPASPLEDPAVTEAAPEAEPEEAGSGETGELEPSDRGLVEAAVRGYVAALNDGSPDAVCAAMAPGSVAPRDFPVELAFAASGSSAEQRRAFCVGAVGATLGRPPRGGGPAWRGTEVNELESVSVGAGLARVTATVTHDYAGGAGGDPGIGLEEDVIYLREVDGEWLVAKPSGTFYRAVGFATPPLRALTPP